MTLIITCLTDDVVYQISDRRLTSFAPPYNLIDDECNKAILMNSRIVVSYSGLSMIEGKRTDDWIAEVIADGSNKDMSVVANRIRDHATRAFRLMRLPLTESRHAFQCSGWFKHVEDDWYSPGIVTVDNAINIRNGSWLPEAEAEFKIQTHFPYTLPGKCTLSSIGATLSAEEKSSVLRLIRKCVKHPRANSSTVMQGLILVCSG